MPGVPAFVGRQAELAQLIGMLTETAGRAVVVSGEPGIGKTALLEQMSDHTAGQGWQVVRVLGVEAEQPFALGNPTHPKATPHSDGHRNSNTYGQRHRTQHQQINLTLEDTGPHNT